MDDHTESPVVQLPIATVVIAVCAAFFVLLITPLVVQVKAGNYPMIVLIVSCGAAMLIRTLNAALWGNSTAANWWDGQGLCDVEIKLYAGLYMTVGGAMVCMTRDLLYAVNIELGLKASKDKLQSMQAAVVWCWCVTLPLIRISLHYIVQPSRYRIIPIHGCTITTDSSWPTLALYTIWPLFPPLAVLYYYGRTWHYASKHKRELSRVFGKTDRPCDPKLKRLFKFSSYMITSYLGILPYGLVLPMFGLPLTQYSWARVHPDDFWTASIQVSLIYSYAEFINDLSLVMLTFMIVLRLGFNAETRAIYRDVVGSLSYNQVRTMLRRNRVTSISHNQHRECPSLQSLDFDMFSDLNTSRHDIAIELAQDNGRNNATEIGACDNSRKHTSLVELA